jgi:hypothetical protein
VIHVLHHNRVPPQHKILGADDVQQGHVMLGQHRDLGPIFVVDRRIVRVDTGHLVGVDPTPVERIDSALAHPDEGRFLRQAVVFRQELVPHVPRLALSAGVGRHKGDVKTAF